MMKKIMLCVIIVLGCSSISYAERPSEEIPMYGGQHTPEVQANKENSRSAARLGWNYLDRGDLDTAIRRFNQAWMFDHDSVDAFWGFGIIMGQRAAQQEDTEHNLRESVKYLEMASSRANNNPKIFVDLAFSYTLLGYYLGSNGKSSESQQYFLKAEELFNRAEKIDSRYPLLYSNWSVQKFYEGDYKAARLLLDKAKALGFTPEPAYEKDLENKLKSLP